MVTFNRLKNEEFVKKVYLSESESLNRRWKDRVGEYMPERGIGRGGGFVYMLRRNVWIGRGEDTSALVIPLWKAHRGSDR